MCATVKLHGGIDGFSVLNLRIVRMGILKFVSWPDHPPSRWAIFLYKFWLWHLYYLCMIKPPRIRDATDITGSWSRNSCLEHHTNMKPRTTDTSRTNGNQVQHVSKSQERMGARQLKLIRSNHSYHPKFWWPLNFPTETSMAPIGTPEMPAIAGLIAVDSVDPADSVDFTFGLGLGWWWIGECFGGPGFPSPLVSWNVLKLKPWNPWPKTLAANRFLTQTRFAVAGLLNP